MSKEAKPCPFCGTKAHVSGSGEFRYASCDDTSCILGLHGYLIEAWNTRALPPEVKALVEAAEEVIETETCLCPKELAALRRLCVCAAMAIDNIGVGYRPMRDNARALRALRRAMRLLKAFEPETARWEREK